MTAELDHLTARLARAADDAGLLDVAFTTVDTPVGPLLLAATDQGLVRVAYVAEDHDAVLQFLADRISPRVLRAPARLDPAVRQLEEYFAGRRTAFDLPLDLRLSAGFRRDVLTRLREVGYGTTASYAALGNSVGGVAAKRTLLDLEAAA
jgi:methylated-DNA-[protein]-cysteine S-methyltransferase